MEGVETPPPLDATERSGTSTEPGLGRGRKAAPLGVSRLGSSLFSSALREKQKRP
jgi:hypothetical protein